MENDNNSRQSFEDTKPLIPPNLGNNHLSVTEDDYHTSSAPPMNAFQAANPLEDTRGGGGGLHGGAAAPEHGCGSYDLQPQQHHPLHHPGSVDLAQCEHHQPQSHYCHENQTSLEYDYTYHHHQQQQQGKIVPTFVLCVSVFNSRHFIDWCTYIVQESSCYCHFGFQANTLNLNEYFSWEH